MCVSNTIGRRLQPLPFIPAQSSQRHDTLPEPLTGTLVRAPPSMPLLATIASNATSASTITTPQCAYAEKLPPKRRRKPQKPGLTANNHSRHFVLHHYHDHAFDVDQDQQVEESSEEQRHRHRGGAVAFPIKLHEVLDQVEASGLAHVISWRPHGRCFMIHKPKEFVAYVMPK